MNGACIICGRKTEEGRQVCRGCEGVIIANADIIRAAIRQTPVEHDGIKYGCVSAIAVRFRSSPLHKQKEPYILQCELMSAQRHCVVIAEPQKVKILKEFER